MRNFLHVSFFPIFARFVFQIEHISFCRIYVFDAGNGIQEIVTVSCTTKGTWSITDKTFNENTTDVDIQITDLSVEGENLTDDQSVIRDFVASEKKRLYYDWIIPLKKEMMGEDSSKIIILNETTCVTVDKDGERTESRKLH